MDEMEARETIIKLKKILNEEKKERTILSDLNDAIENQNVVLYSFGEIMIGRRIRDRKEFNENYKQRILRMIDEHKHLLDEIIYKRRRIRERFLSGGFDWGLIEKRLKEKIL